jgi:hypothetical protein
MQGIGIDVVQREIPSSSVAEVGLFVGLRDPSNPPDGAKTFLEMLHNANIEAHYTSWSLIPTPLEDPEVKDIKLTCMSQNHLGEVDRLPWGFGT